jgi:hypothetical protein
MPDINETIYYKGPSGGWGALQGIDHVFGKEWNTIGVLETLLRQNKTHGVMCTSCAWAKPSDHHTFEFCENGAKATIWELTANRCTPEFFAQHSVTELRGWNITSYSPAAISRRFSASANMSSRKTLRQSSGESAFWTSISSHSIQPVSRRSKPR